MFQLLLFRRVVLGRNARSWKIKLCTNLETYKPENSVLLLVQSMAGIELSSLQASYILEHTPDRPVNLITSIKISWKLELRLSGCSGLDPCLQGEVHIFMLLKWNQ